MALAAGGSAAAGGIQYTPTHARYLYHYEHGADFTLPQSSDLPATYQPTCVYGATRQDIVNNPPPPIRTRLSWVEHMADVGFTSGDRTAGAADRDVEPCQSFWGATLPDPTSLTDALTPTSVLGGASCATALTVSEPGGRIPVTIGIPGPNGMVSTGGFIDTGASYS